MKTNHYKTTLPLIGALLCATAASAQQTSPAAPDPANQTWDPFVPSHPQDQKMEKAEPQSLNRITGSLRFGLNISGKFNNIGTGFNPLPGGGPTTTPNGDPYNYGDGYVYPDSGNSPPGLTSYWGYDSAGQVHAINTASPYVSLDSTTANTSPSKDIDTNPGFEMTYNRELGIKEDWHHMHYGIEGAFNYLPITFNTDGTFNEYMLSTPYPFAAGTTPPGYNNPDELPYQGSYQGPGFALGTMPSGPSTSALMQRSSLSVQDHFDGDLWGFRLGPYVEFPLGEKVSLHVSGGFAVGLLDANANWNETLTYAAGGSSSTLSGSGSDTSMLWGGYVSCALQYQINQRWGVEADVQFQDLGKYDHNFGGRSVELNLSQSFFVGAGVTYSF